MGRVVDVSASVFMYAVGFCVSVGVVILTIGTVAVYDDPTLRAHTQKGDHIMK